MWAHSMVGPRTFEMVEVDAPKTDELVRGEVVVELGAGAICGSDLPHFQGVFAPGEDRFGVPGSPLHEVVGTIVEANGSDLEVGDRVVGWARDHNGLAESFVTDAAMLLPLDARFAGLSDVEVTMLQPLACVLYAVSRLRSVRGRRTAVIGQGPLGVLFSHVLHDLGASRVIAIDQVDRSDVAGDFGVDEMVWGSSYHWAQQLRTADRADVVIEAVGHQTDTMNDAITALADGGEILAFGVPTSEWYAVAFHRLFRRNGTLVTGTVRPYRDSLVQAAEYLTRHPGLPGIYLTDVYGVDQANDAFHRANLPAAGRLKVGLRR